MSGKLSLFIVQPASAIETALRFCETHRVEIDEWIQRNGQAA
jgi:hypothetical protein